MSRIWRALILGAPASGKGTISARVVQRYNFEHVSSGDRLRANARDATPLGGEVRRHLADGSLVPDALMCEFILGELARARGSWLLDGFPRTEAQARALWRAQPVDFALNLRVPFDVIVERARGRWVHPASGRVYNAEFNAPKVAGKDDATGEDLEQRPDDRPEAVRRRLEIYATMTEPVIEFYKGKGILTEFEGRTSDEIWPKVIAYLDHRLNLTKA